MAVDTKKIDGFQVLKSVFDIDKNCLRVCIVDGTPDTPGGGLEVVIDHTNDSIRLGDGSKLVTATTDTGKTGIDSYVINTVDIRDLDSSRDNIAIVDSNGDELDILPDGSIKTASSINTSISGLQKYNSITSLASATETIITTHTTVGGRDTYLQAVDASGDNIAKYVVKVNGTAIDSQRTSFGGMLNCSFKYDGEVNPGLKMVVGDVITVTVIHSRPSAGDFEAKIKYIEVI